MEVICCFDHTESICNACLAKHEAFLCRIKLCGLFCLLVFQLPQGLTFSLGFQSNI